MSTISEAGVYDLPADEYHRDPVAAGSLSSTGARQLLPPSCPALFKHHRDHGRPPKRCFDIGHAVHGEVLGVGAPLVVINKANYNRKAAQETRDAAYAAGQVPVLAWEYERVLAMTRAVRDDPYAGPLFAAAGPVEQTLVWRDNSTGVWCRAMLDKQIPDLRIVVDLKTGKSAAPSSVSKSMADYGYHQQGAFYKAGVNSLGLYGGVDPAYVLVTVDVNPPHLVTAAQIELPDLAWGDKLNRKALSIYRQCAASNTWPGYTSQIISVGLPYWTTRQLEDAQARGEFDSEDMPWPTTP